MIGKTVFTTGEAAKVCLISQQTIIRNFDDGLLGGYRIPGSRFRRIPRAELILFMRKHRIPLGYLTGHGTYTVVAVTADELIKNALSAVITMNAGFNLLFSHDTFEAGTVAKDACASAVIIDGENALGDAQKIARWFKQSGDNAPTNVVAFVQGDPPLGPPEMQCMVEVFHKPFDPTLLVERLQTLCRSV